MKAAVGETIPDAVARTGGSAGGCHRRRMAVFDAVPVISLTNKWVGRQFDLDLIVITAGAVIRPRLGRIRESSDSIAGGVGSFFGRSRSSPQEMPIVGEVRVRTYPPRQNWWRN